MKVVHFGRFAPHACGLYHTMKDLIKAERGVGIDAHFVDVVSEKGICKVQPPSKVDGLLTTSDVKEARDADVLVRHTSIPNDLENCGIPIMIAVHGRPESSLRLDQAGTIPVVEAFYNKGRDARHKAFFTFWAEHLPFWRLIIPEKKLHFVPAMVDLMEWRPGNVKPFDLGKHNGRPNILVADIWRDDITPFQEIMAVARFIKEQCPEGRLHVAAAPTGNGAQIFWRALRKQGVLGYAVGQTKDIKALYEAADVVVTPHTIATRVIREALAMATPVVSSGHCGYTPYCPGEEIDGLAGALKLWLLDFGTRPAIQQINARKMAEQRFNLKQTGLAIKKVFEGVLTRKSTRRKVLIDLGGHLGETVRRFFKQVPDARFYDIFTFEPYQKCFDKLKTVLGGLKNVHPRMEAVVRCGTGTTRKLYLGKTNSADGSTFLKGKTTGEVSYEKGHTVRCVDLREMLVANEIADGDYIVLKMNIEGGEYELMQYILDAKIMGYFDQIYIQLHKDKLNNADRVTYMQLENRFAKEAVAAGVQVFMTDKGMAPFQCEGGAA